MRLLGLALFTLLVMGLIQFALWTDRDTTSRGLGPLSQADRAVHDFASDVVAGVRDTRPGDRHHTVVVREEDTWGALSGSPGYHRARFNLPRDARIEAGTLTLDLTAQLQDEGVARLKINVNGQRRGELVLPAGKSEHRVTLNLLPADLTQSVLEVTLAANGRFPTAVCTARWSGGMVLRVEPTSHLDITTDAPLTTLDDRLRVSGDPARVLWDGQMGAETMARMLRFAVHQEALGAKLDFVAPQRGAQDGAIALSPNDLDVADAYIAATPAQVPPVWPMQPAAASALWDAKFFEYRTNWRIPYDLRRTPDGTLPTHFDVDLSLVGLDQADRWMLSVVLNGRGIHTERLSADIARIARSVALPPQHHRFANVLELHLVNDEPRSGVTCLSGTPVMAQLEAGTRLRGGIAPPDPDAATFGAVLPDNLSLVVTSAFNATEATSAVRFLSDAFGEATRWTPSDVVDLAGPGTVQLVLRNTLPEVVAQARAAGPRDLWVLWPRLGGATDAPYALARITADADLTAYMRADGGRIAALVSLPLASQDGQTEQVAQTARTVDLITKIDGLGVLPAFAPLHTPVAVAPARLHLPQPIRPALETFVRDGAIKTGANAPLLRKPSMRPVPRPGTSAAQTVATGPVLSPVQNPMRMPIERPVRWSVAPQSPAVMAIVSMPRAEPVVH